MPDFDDMLDGQAGEEQSPEGSEGQAPKQEETFTALDEDVITGDLEDDDDDVDLPDDDVDAEEETTEQEEEGVNEPEVADPDNPEKRVQTPEERAYYAEMRRQREAQQRMEEQLQYQLEMMRQTMPEAQIAQILSQQYGLPPQELLHRLQEAQLAKEAESLGVTPEQLRFQRQQEAMMAQQQAYLQQQQQFVQMQALMTRLQKEGMEVTQKYPTLSHDDLTEAVIWGYENNAIHMPLEYLVRAKHAEKLFAADREAARQEALAKVSGRMRSGIKAPEGKAPSGGTTLTPTELHFAKKFGMTPEEYAKWKADN